MPRPEVEASALEGLLVRPNKFRKGEISINVHGRSPFVIHLPGMAWLNGKSRRSAQVLKDISGFPSFECILNCVVFALIVNK